MKGHGSLVFANVRARARDPCSRLSGRSSSLGIPPIDPGLNLGPTLSATWGCGPRWWRALSAAALWWPATTSALDRQPSPPSLQLWRTVRTPTVLIGTSGASSEAVGGGKAYGVNDACGEVACGVEAAVAFGENEGGAPS